MILSTKKQYLHFLSPTCLPPQTSIPGVAFPYVSYTSAYCHWWEGRLFSSRSTSVLCHLHIILLPNWDAFFFFFFFTRGPDEVAIFHIRFFVYETQPLLVSGFIGVLYSVVEGALEVGGCFWNRRKNSISFLFLFLLVPLN